MKSSLFLISSNDRVIPPNDEAILPGPAANSPETAVSAWRNGKKAVIGFAFDCAARYWPIVTPSLNGRVRGALMAYKNASHIAIALVRRLSVESLIQLRTRHLYP